jgi:hypothetical protein
MPKSENRSHPRKLEWCPGAESNHRHADFQSAALPTELPGLALLPGWRRGARPKVSGLYKLIFRLSTVGRRAAWAIRPCPEKLPDGR